MKESGKNLDWDKLLKDKVYRDSERKIEFKEGRQVRFHIKTERPLTYDDVLSVRIDGSNVIFTTADGKKYVESVVYKSVNNPDVKYRTETDNQIVKHQTERRVKRERKVS